MKNAKERVSQAAESGQMSGGRKIVSCWRNKEGVGESGFKCNCRDRQMADS